MEGCREESASQPSALQESLKSKIRISMRGDQLGLLCATEKPKEEGGVVMMHLDAPLGKEERRFFFPFFFSF